jgi:transcriptional regulator with PAS, ATPase and Fis domain
MTLLEAFIKEILLEKKTKKKTKRAYKALDNKLDDMSTQVIQSALDKNDNNVADAAKEIGVKRTTMYYRMDRLNIDNE